MSFLSKLANHVMHNGFNSQYKGAEVANRLAKTIGIDHPVGKLVLVGAGTLAGSFIGGVRIISPLSIVETAILTEEQEAKRIDGLGDWSTLDL